MEHLIGLWLGYQIAANVLFFVAYGIMKFFEVFG